MVVLPGLWLADVFPDEEWDELGPNEANHPQYHLKLLLDRIVWFVRIQRGGRSRERPGREPAASARA